MPTDSVDGPLGVLSTTATGQSFAVTLAHGTKLVFYFVHRRHKIIQGSDIYFHEENTFHLYISLIKVTISVGAITFLTEQYLRANRSSPSRQQQQEIACLL